MTKLKPGGHPDLKMVNPNAAAIDIGSTMHMAAVNPDTDIMPVRAFGTFTQDLLDLADWFRSCGATSVAMESTGVYWIPAFEILEELGFEVILVNARYAKNVPGRKSDVSDAGWLRQSSSRAAALLRLAAVTIGRSDTALGAFYRRLSARIGKQKAVTATARKIAVLFYNAIRHGMTYQDQGAAAYDERHRQRVLSNLQRRAKTLGFALAPITETAAVS